MDKNIHEYKLLPPALDLSEMGFQFLELLLLLNFLYFKLFVGGKSLTPAAEAPSNLPALVELIPQELKIIQLGLDLVFFQQDLLDFGVHHRRLLPIAVEVAVEVDHEVERQLVRVLEQHILILLVLGPVYVQEEVLGELFYEGLSVVDLPVDFHFVVELGIQCTEQITVFWVQDHAHEVCLQLLVAVRSVLHLLAVEQPLYILLGRGF